jgi:hemoglobin
MSLESRQDIKNSKDIKKLVNNFYVKVVADELLGPFFEEIANTDWTLHLPKMYDFWETILFDGTYSQGNPVLRHIEIDHEKNMEKEHFDQWLLLFSETVDEYFTGLKAIEIKERANRISEVLQKRIKGSRHRQAG